VTKALSDVNLVVGGCNLAFLALGRFVFLPYQRDQVRYRYPPCRAARARRLKLHECAARAAPYPTQPRRGALRFVRARA
jgi:hypothetical protein